MEIQGKKISSLAQQGSAPTQPSPLAHHATQIANSVLVSPHPHLSSPHVLTPMTLHLESPNGHEVGRILELELEVILPAERASID